MWRREYNRDMDKLVRVKVRTMAQTQFELAVAASTAISDLKQQIAQRTGLPIDSQRLIYQGRVLDNSETLAGAKVRTGHVLQLVRTQEREASSPMTLLSDLPFLVPRRRRYLFPHREIDPAERFEVLRQSIQTLDGLIQSTASAPGTQPFERLRRQYAVGQWVDVRDTVDQWLEAQVVDVRNTDTGLGVKVHYNGWPNRWDEWLDAASPRIQPLRTNTMQAINSPMHSAHLICAADAEGLQPQAQPDFGELVFQACGLLDHVGNMLDRLYVLRRLAAQEGELDRRELTPESLQLLKPAEEKRADDLRSDLSILAISSVQEPLSDTEEVEGAPTTDQEALLLSAQLAPILDRAGRLLADLGVVLSGAGTARRLDDTQSVSSSLMTNESGSSQLPHLPMQVPAMATPSELSVLALGHVLSDF